jgi:hypothetical protein
MNSPNVPIEVSIDNGTNFISSKDWRIKVVIQDMRIVITSKDLVTAGSLIDVIIRID